MHVAPQGDGVAELVAARQVVGAECVAVQRDGDAVRSRPSGTDADADADADGDGRHSARRVGDSPCAARCAIIMAGGPLRIVAWSTWSGRERSSHSRLPQVPQIRLASCFSPPLLPCHSPAHRCRPRARLTGTFVRRPVPPTLALFKPCNYARRCSLPGPLPRQAIISSHHEPLGSLARCADVLQWRFGRPCLPAA